MPLGGESYLPCHTTRRVGFAKILADSQVLYSQRLTAQDSEILAKSAKKGVAFLVESTILPIVNMIPGVPCGCQAIYFYLFMLGRQFVGDPFSFVVYSDSGQPWGN